MHLTRCNWVCGLEVSLIWIWPSQQNMVNSLHHFIFHLSHNETVQSQLNDQVDSGVARQQEVARKKRRVVWKEAGPPPVPDIMCVCWDCHLASVNLPSKPGPGSLGHTDTFVIWRPTRNNCAAQTWLQYVVEESLLSSEGRGFDGEGQSPGKLLTHWHV